MDAVAGGIGTHQHHLVADRDPINAGDVNHDPVHADRSGDPCPLPPDQDLGLIGQGPGIAVGIADRYAGDQRPVAGGESAGVADGGAGLDPFQHGDAALQPHDRPQIDLSLEVGRRQRSVQGNARPDQIAVGTIAEQHAGAVVDMDITGGKSGRARCGDHLSKPFGLEAGEAASPFIEFVSAGEMGNDTLQRQVGQRAQFIQEGGGVGIRDPQTPHAGVDLEMDLCLAEQPAGGLVECLGLLHGEYGGGQVETDAFAFLSGIDAAQQQDRFVDAAFAELYRFSQKGDPEGIDPQIVQFAADLFESMAVGVRLDHCQDFRGDRQPGADDPVVVLKGGKIDLCECRATFEHVPGSL